MKRLIALIMLLAASAFGQEAPNTPTPQPPTPAFYAVGLFYNNGATPAVAGTALYARKLTDAGTYPFVVLDVIPNTVKPLTVTNNFGVGLAQQLVTLGEAKCFVTASSGISYTGTNTGWMAAWGGMCAIPLKKGYIAPSVRIAKSSVSNGTAYQLIPGIMYAWGSVK